MSETIAYQPTGRWALANGRIVLPDRVVTDQTLIVEGSTIVDLVEASTLASSIEEFDVGGRYITAGLIDLHMHGALGHSFNDANPVAFQTITAELARRGVTAVLATLATAPIPALVAAIDASRSWMMHSPQRGAQVLGVHLEGPYFSREQCGAQDPRSLRTPDDGTSDILLEHRDVLSIMSFAPELPGALELTTRLARLGIVPAAGHSSAQDDDVLAAMRCGLRHVIHLWSGQSSTIRDGPWRKPGLLEAALCFEGLTCEMISDNRHLPPTLMRLAYKCCGPDRLCVISDATSGAGLPNGSRFGMGEMVYVVDDGVGMLLDRTAFAGSVTLIDQMLPILTGVVGVPLPEAVRMLTLTPAHVIGWDHRKGSLTAGKDADLVIFDDNFMAWRTMIAGQWVQPD